MEAPNPYRPRPRVTAKNTADLVILSIRDDLLKILLVVRGNEPFTGRLALPGGFLRPGDRLPPLHLHTYPSPKRDPRGRGITTAFLAIAPDLPGAVGGTDARSADWVEVEDSLRTQLAFDHWIIVDDAMKQIRSELEYTPLATSFCPQSFTISELRRVFELVWDSKIDPGNFRRKVSMIKGFIEPTGEKRHNRDGGRPAALYRRGRSKTLNPPLRPPTRY